MKILLVIPSVADIGKGGYYSGVDYHRMYIPHKALYNQWDDIEFITTNDISALSQEELNECTAVVVNRVLSKIGKHKEAVEMLNKSEAKLIVDMDDDYMLPSWHIMYEAYRANNTSREIVETLKRADYVTCTHYRLANVIKEITNVPISIIPNSILPSEPQFEVTPELVTDRLVFGWSGSVTHFEDVLEMYDSIVPLLSDPILGDKIKIMYGGFEVKDRVSQAIASVLTGKSIAKPEQFMYAPAAKSSEYAYYYNMINVCLIPLRPNRFNSNKSNLKMLECGFKKRAAIVSEVDPYLSVINKTPKNCLTVKNRHDWFKHMSKLAKNPNMRYDLAEQLHEDVQPYHANEISKIRYQLYKTLIN